MAVAMHPGLNTVKNKGHGANQFKFNLSILHPIILDIRLQ
jgi:hypothetical protein